MGKLNYSDLIRAIAEETGQSQEAVKATLSALTNAVVKAAQNGQEVPLPKFGTFRRSDRAARPGRNPATGETIQIEASSNLAFKAAPAVKDVMNA